MIDFDALYIEHRPAVLRWCKHIIRDDDTAKEMAQEVFMRAWRGRDKFSGKSSVKTWLYAITKRVLLNELRRRSRIPESVNIEADRLPSRSPNLSVGLDVGNLLGRLKDGARLAVELTRIEGMSGEEAAARLGIASPAFIHLGVEHSLKQLRKFVTKEAYAT